MIFGFIPTKHHAAPSSPSALKMQAAAVSANK